MKKLQIIFLLCMIALGNAGYLVYRRYCLTFLEPTQSFCDINATYSCSNVLTHPAALIAGIPFPAVALLVYPILAIIAYRGYVGKTSSHWTLLSVLSGLGILFNSYFIYQETFVIKAFCLLCVICFAIIVSIFVMSLVGAKKSQ